MKNLMEVGDAIDDMIGELLTEHKVGYHLILFDEEGFTLQGTIPNTMAASAINTVIAQDEGIKDGEVTKH